MIDGCMNGPGNDEFCPVELGVDGIVRAMHSVYPNSCSQIVPAKEKLFTKPAAYDLGH